MHSSSFGRWRYAEFALAFTVAVDRPGTSLLFAIGGEFGEGCNNMDKRRKTDEHLVVADRSALPNT